MRPRLCPSILVCLFLALPSTAAAQVKPFASVSPPVDAASRSRFDLGLGRARLELPDLITGVRSIVARADEFDHQRRGRFFPMTPILRQLARGAQGHPGAALALLEPLLYPEHFARPTSPTALIALRAGLLEAAGDLQDPVAGSVYRAILASGTEFYELRAAAEALGKLSLDADVATLARLATTAGPAQDAVISGLGSCRRLAAAAALSKLASTRPAPERAKRVAGALGRLGSAWALATPNAAPASEVAPLRRTAALAALALYQSATDPEVSAAASDALMTIDAPETPALIEAALAPAPAELRLALVALRTRFEHNPTRGSR